MCKRICGLYSSKKPSQQDWQSQPAALPHRADETIKCVCLLWSIDSQPWFSGGHRKRCVLVLLSFPTLLIAQCILLYLSLLSSVVSHFGDWKKVAAELFIMASTHTTPLPAAGDLFSHMCAYVWWCVYAKWYVTRHDDFKIMFLDSWLEHNRLATKLIQMSKHS